MAETKHFFSIPEAAEIIGISRIAVFKRVKKGQLPGIRIGRNWAIPAGALTPPEPRPPQAPNTGIPDLKILKAPETAPEPQKPSIAAETEPEIDPLDEMGWD